MIIVLRFLIYYHMMTILTTNAQPDVMGSFIKIFLFIYFIPTMIALLRVFSLKWKFFAVFFINLFFGWSIYGWWISFMKAFSSKQKIIIQNKISSNESTSTDKYDKLEKLNNLRITGAISEKEYESEKSKILN